MPHMAGLSFDASMADCGLRDFGGFDLEKVVEEKEV